MWVKRGVLNARLGASPDAQLTVSGPKTALVGVVLKPGTGHQLADDGHVQLDGDAAVLNELADVMDEFDPNFNIVTP
ncbi:alkyl sulfatase C-terminal domain-containing protein [Microbacterium phyllosphaerae]|uniref:alkyl sulfatase C-terminal domain-containing protein n=1 Tax=Microbacterium phyllosphaerae TaxID=124798 RepID=UPI003D649160